MNAVRSNVIKGVSDSVQQRIELINDPKEVLDTLKFDYISLDVVEKMINGIMERLGFRLPEKLMAPTTMFAFTNIFASKI